MAVKLARFDSEGRPVAFFDPELEYPNDDLSDTVPISDEDWEEFINNPGVRRWDGEKVVPCDPPQSVVTWDEVRTRRNALLAASDWTQLPDVPLVNKEAWAQYRQALRDIPQKFHDPANVIWPVPPTELVQ